jgi:hypothetical protein
MPQSRSGGSSGSGASRSSSGSGARRARSTGSGSRSTSSRAASSRSARSTSAKRTTAKRTTAKRTTAKRTTSSSARTAKPKPGSPDARLEAAANRVRKLNEQIIAAGREAGETTLTNYEKFLKSIAGSLERGPGKSDVEWISNLAQAQAKFIRDVTSSLTKAARKRLK